MKKWTNKEIKALRDNYQNKSREDLCYLFVNRSWDSIKQKAHRLNLTLPDVEKRFWKYVDKKQKHVCWNWLGACDTGGYGKIWRNGQQIIAHRFSWVLTNSNIPDGLCVLHRCDNRKCVNPHHLFLGTYRDNSNDRDNKNRQAKGESHGRHKLSVNQVKEIKKLKGKFSQRMIARMFKVDHTLIGHIHRNENWKHIK